MRVIRLQTLPRTDQFYTLLQTYFVTSVDILSADFNVCKMCCVVCVLHHTDYTAPILWNRTHNITDVYITPQKLKNFNLHYFVISHCYPTLFHTINKKYKLTEIMYIFKIML
jgi:hypothetical protein